MAVVTPVVPPTRRNVELVLLLFAIVVAEAAYAIVGLTVQGSVPQDWWLVGGGGGGVGGGWLCSPWSSTASCGGAPPTPTR
jgi:hypothetical protein